MKTPHKHADLIKAWADGAEIEMYNPRFEAWEFLNQPSWSDDITYRIKPELKPDVVLHYNEGWVRDTGRERWHFGDSLRVTLDGETGKFKSAEVI